MGWIAGGILFEVLADMSKQNMENQTAYKTARDKTRLIGKTDGQAMEKRAG